MSAEADLKNNSSGVLVPGGNRPKVSQETTKKKNKELVKIQQTTTKLPESVINAACVKSLSCLGTGASCAGKRRVTEKWKQNGIKSSKAAAAAAAAADSGVEEKLVSPEPENIIKRRCHWITPNSDPLYASFHDEEWGIPVHDDNKLFELLVFSQALGELSWPTILNQRDLFRKLFDKFDIASVAKYTEKKILTLKVHGNFLLSEPKLHAVVENARQILKVQQEFGSLNNYCWGFVNHKQIKNSHRYARQVPVKTPKAEVISKDLMRRGFRCVGPTVVYSFMQVTGIVNDHLITCFRYQECVSNVKRDESIG